MEKVLKDYKYLILLWILCIAGLVFFTGHYAGILIDFGREVYYPERILDGKILYKDLFNIYGPLSYQINALLYKIFGAKLSTLYGAGAVCSILTVSGIFLIAQKFLSKFLSFCIGFFTIAVGITATSIFNFHFPYSWAVLYGLVSFLFSLYFLLDKKNLKMSAFLAGISITCKYDFILYAFVVLFFIIKSKDLKAFLCFAIAPFISYGILFIQGLGISDLTNSLAITAAMAKSKTLTYFYQNSGVYFHPRVIPTLLILFLKTAIPFAGILTGAYLFDRNKVASISFSILGYLSMIWFVTENIKVVFGFLPVLLTIFAITSYKKLNSNLIILTVSTVAVCVKVFWVLIIQSYGSYYVSIALIAFFAILFKNIPQKLEKSTGIYILIISAIILVMNIIALKYDNNKITTAKGTIYTNKNYADSSNLLINYLKNNSDENDSVVIFPEGMTINFLADRKADDFYNSLLPLYTESLDEDKIIEHYKNEKPEFIIFNNLNMKDYYFNYICQDYATDFCAFVQENYNQSAVIDNGFRYIIFKRK